jgi:ABC-type Fe3+-citrate transport system substrate-binding protein
MRKLYFVLMVLLAGLVLSGCSDEKLDSGSSVFSLPDENGKEVSLENMDKPALVFFFTGVG